MNYIVLTPALDARGINVWPKQDDQSRGQALSLLFFAQFPRFFSNAVSHQRCLKFTSTLKYLEKRVASSCFSSPFFLEFSVVHSQHLLPILYCR